MCDYSLEGRKSREAEVGDKLIIGAYGHGFVTVALNDLHEATGPTATAPVCFTCVKEGTVLSLNITSASRYTGCRVVAGRFSNARVIKRRPSLTCSFKDLLVLKEGDELFDYVPIAYLGKGTTATVVSIPGVKPVRKAKKVSLETKLGLDKLNAKVTTAKDPAKVAAIYKRAARKRTTAKALATPRR